MAAPLTPLERFHHRDFQTSASCPELSTLPSASAFPVQADAMDDRTTNKSAAITGGSAAAAPRQAFAAWTATLLAWATFGCALSVAEVAVARSTAGELAPPAATAAALLAVAAVALLAVLPWPPLERAAENLAGVGRLAVLGTALLGVIMPGVLTWPRDPLGPAGRAARELAAEQAETVRILSIGVLLLAAALWVLGQVRRPDAPPRAWATAPLALVTYAAVSHQHWPVEGQLLLCAVLVAIGLELDLGVAARAVPIGTRSTAATPAQRALLTAAASTAALAAAWSAIAGEAVWPGLKWFYVVALLGSVAAFRSPRAAQVAQAAFATALVPAVAWLIDSPGFLNIGLSGLTALGFLAMSATLWRRYRASGATGLAATQLTVGLTLLDLGLALLLGVGIIVVGCVVGSISGLEPIVPCSISPN